MGKSLVKSTSLVSAMTFLSRILGLVRDVILAYVFGASAAYDAFLVAFKIPNFMRRLFAEGAFAQAFVPVLSEYRQQRSLENIQQFARNMSGTLGLALLLVTVLAILSAPILVSVFAPGFVNDPVKFDLAVSMLRITFPYLFLISLTAFAGAILNCYDRFGPPAFTPVFLNITLIISAWILAPNFQQPIFALAVGVFLAGIVQLSFQLPFLARLQLLVWPKINWQDPGVRRVLKLMIPALFGVSVVQVSLLIDVVFASFLQTGSVTWLYYSDRLMMFPLGVFGVAIATVILPSLSRDHAKKYQEEFSATLDWAIRSVLLIGLPAALGLGLLSGPLMATILGYGQFTDFDVAMAQKSLMAFSLGVPFFMLIKILASGFYAQQNIKTPVKIAVIALVTNVIFNVVLIKPLAHVGLALATSLSAVVNVSLLFAFLIGREVYAFAAGWGLFICRLLIACAFMGFCVVWLNVELEYWLDWLWYQRVGYLLLLVIVAKIAYVASLFLTGLRVSDVKPTTV